jgi:thiamine-monophosphate kinase
VSDGLAGDVRHLAAASGAGIEIDLESLPQPPRAGELCDRIGTGWSDLALSGGEDYELLFSIPEARWARAPKPRNTRFTVIGRMMPARHGITVRDRDGVRPLFEEGFSHFG